MGIPHFLAIPYPVLGHVNPVMQFSQVLAEHGCKVTFVHTEFNHKRTNTAGAELDNNLKGSQIKFVTLPDGLDPEDDRSDQMKVRSSIISNMPALLPKLIEDINTLDVDNKINCVIVTINMGWALEVGHKLGIKGALLWTSSATCLAACYCIPRLIDEGIIDSEMALETELHLLWYIRDGSSINVWRDNWVMSSIQLENLVEDVPQSCVDWRVCDLVEDGVPTKKQEIQLSQNMPMMDTAHLPWGSLGKIFFNLIFEEMKILESGEWWLCNTTYDLESSTFSISPKLLPIGPLISNDKNKSSFWQEDTTCLEWLDQQPPQSVIYVSFGSLAVMDPNQFKELALGLSLLNKPFLWVVRPGNDNKVNYTYPKDFNGSKGKIVDWAPQKKILNHPSIACFISHCGWNSTMEGVYSGTPFLCWPFFTDQFLGKSYICDVWKIGLGLDKDENGLISREEIKKKVEQLLGDEDIKARSLKLKEMTMNNIAEGGVSSKNVTNFINWAKY